VSALQALQRRMQESVLSGGPAALGEVVGDARADAAERLGVYQHAYRARLREVLAGDYPGLALLAGAAAEDLFDAYCAARRSRHYNVRWYGEGLAAFLAGTAPWSARPELAAMARFEWALSTVFDAEDQPPAGRAELAAIAQEDWARLCLVPQPALALVDLAWNLDAFRRAADQGTAAPALAGHAEPRRWAVWRQALGVRYRALDADEALLWPAVAAGEPLAAWCESLAQVHGEEAAIGRVVVLLQRWLDEGWAGALALAGEGQGA
jgi:hypothetical protein